MKIYSKESIITELRKIRDLGWVENRRPGNVGGIGNTLEDLLGIKENNLPLPNAAEWELKCQRKDSASLMTMFHMEPSPRAMKFVPSILLPKYGWSHQTIENEMSFRQTINGLSYSDRGFKVVVDRIEGKVLVSFDYTKVSNIHNKWLEDVNEKVGLGELSPQPYWGIKDLFCKAGTKLLNCFYISAETKKEAGKEYFHYTEIYILKDFESERFLDAIEKGYIYVDFDARSGHNHGTKFRIKQNMIPSLYNEVIKI